MDGDQPVLPKDSKSKGKKPLLFVGIGVGVAVAITIVVLLAFQQNTPQYSLSVEPRSEMVMGSGMNMRVYITNTGSQPLTNVKLNWGSTSDSLPILNPGEKEMFSPPSSATTVIVTTDQGISITKSLMS